MYLFSLQNKIEKTYTECVRWKPESNDTLFLYIMKLLFKAPNEKLWKTEKYNMEIDYGDDFKNKWSYKKIW